MAWANLGRSIGAEIYGSIESSLAQGEAFLIMGVLGLIGAGILTLLRLENHDTKIAEINEAELAR